MSNRTYRPDKWELIKVVKDDQVIYKVLGEWSGSYLTGYSWRISSGVVGLMKTKGNYIFQNHSGSIYKCGIQAKYLGLTTSSIFEKIKEQAEEENFTVELISVEQLKEELILEIENE